MAEGNHAPDSLKYQWRLYGLVSRSDWATSLDKSIAYEIVDNYFHKYGNSRASLSYLVQATGATRANVIASTRRLVARGPFTVQRQGAGTRPTEYGLLFQSLDDVQGGIAYDTATAAATTSPPPHHPPEAGGVSNPSGIACDTPCSIACDTSTGSSGIACNTQSVLHVPAIQPGYVDRTIDIDVAVAAPPPAPRPDGAGGVVPAHDFESLWRAYAFRQKKAEARAAWVKIAPTPERAANIIEAAEVWRDAWEAGGGAATGRRTLAAWLDREEFDCDPPGRREKPLKARTRPANDNAPAAAPKVASGPPRQAVRHRVGVAACDLQEDGGNQTLMVVMTAADGRTFQKAIVLQAAVESEQAAGQRELDLLCLAAGHPRRVDDTSALIGAEIEIDDGPAGFTFVRPSLQAGAA